MTFECSIVSLPESVPVLERRLDAISSIEAIPVSYPEPNDFDALRHLCLCKITTDDGLVGWGESITQFPEASRAAKAVLEGMGENLLGRNRLHTEALWRQCKDQAWWYGYGGGIAAYAVSAIDIALWDLKGKILGASVLDLLGGPCTSDCRQSRHVTLTTRLFRRWSKRHRSGLRRVCRE